MGCLGSHLAPEAAGCQPSNEGCTQLLKHLGLIYIIIFNTTPRPPTWSLDCWRSYCTMCSTSSTCSSRAVKVHRRDGAWVSTGHQGVVRECGAIPHSAIQGCQHRWCKVLGKPWRYCGPLLALVTERSCEGAVCCISWDRTNTSQLSGIDFWQRIQEAAAVLASSSPPPLYYNACCSEILNSAINNLLYQQHAFALFEMVLWGK